MINRIAIIIGTRPEIIKFSPIINELDKRNADYYILHTGQHYTLELDSLIFNSLKLPEPHYNIDVGSGLQNEQVAKMLSGIEQVFLKNRPDMVLVLGDTNSTFAGAYVASKMHIEIGHIEAGLRSFDRKMPEEINRVLVDHCSNMLFCPTDNSKELLAKEGINDNVYVTGNTIVDAVNRNLELATMPSSTRYILVTIHRTENVDDKDKLAKILYSLEKVRDIYNVQVVFPVHPHTLSKIKEFGLCLDGINVIAPVDYLSMLGYENNALAIMTDSGGIQEEACILDVPCVTLRDNTERPETIGIGANILAGTEPNNVLSCLDKMLNAERCWDNPFGDGKASERIVDIIGNIN